MQARQIANQTIAFHRYNTVIVGSGAAGMNCAVHLYEFSKQKGIENPQNKIAVVTAGLGLGASRMSGSDKQTYYKLGTSPGTADSAEELAKTLTCAGCCHADLALAEAIGSLHEFYHLVQAGVPFPTDSMGSFIGYKTDNDPAERATSAGPKTSRFMSECLQKQVENYGITIFDNQEVVHLLTVSSGDHRKITGVVTIDTKNLAKSHYAINVYLAANIVLAAGGPGELYKASVYPKEQFGIHTLAFKAGLVAENLTESQFGLASVKFRWNVSGTYMQAIPRIFSADPDGKNEREFLADFFPSMSKMATNIFLKGYQWPFDPQRIEGFQSSLIDVLVFNETQKGRRIFMDFCRNPLGLPLRLPQGLLGEDKNWGAAGNSSMKAFDINDLEPEAHQYLNKAGAIQTTPIERLSHMNPLAIEIYKENGIDLYCEPLEIALCAQHNNGGFAVDKWWQSNIPHTFVIGEMAGTHGVKRPGGSALNAGQVGGLRAAQYIANAYGCDVPACPDSETAITEQLSSLIARLDRYRKSGALIPAEVIEDIQNRMTASAGHIRQVNDARHALDEALRLYGDVQRRGLSAGGPEQLITAVRAEHQTLASIAYLKAVVELFRQGAGSRGSYLVLAEDGAEIHPNLVNEATGQSLKFKPENPILRDTIIQIEYDEGSPDLFRCRNVSPRAAPADRKVFEQAWRDYREGKIYQQ